MFVLRSHSVELMSRGQKGAVRVGRWQDDGRHAERLDGFDGRRAAPVAGRDEGEPAPDGEARAAAAAESPIPGRLPRCCGATGLMPTYK
jgi:hypothetical protein